ncbi:MAG: pilus assembly protein TadG-related protein, partial [Gammaproteobacteria bacterium]|nr:pilus assembly protein TadG-related protein [Gammaproteobacteria bacterium]
MASITITKQRGAMGLLGILTLLLATLFAALAVDTGRLLMEQRRMQTVADMAALDASSLAGHCGEGNVAQVQAAAEASAARNNHVIAADKTLQITLGRVDVGSGGLRQFTSTRLPL